MCWIGAPIPFCDLWWCSGCTTMAAQSCSVWHSAHRSAFEVSCASKPSGETRTKGDSAGYSVALRAAASPGRQPAQRGQAGRSGAASPHPLSCLLAPGQSAHLTAQCWGRRGQPVQRRSHRRRRVTCMALDVGELPPAALAGALSVAGFGILRAAVYFRLQVRDVFRCSKSAALSAFCVVLTNSAWLSCLQCCR